MLLFWLAIVKILQQTKNGTKTSVGWIFAYLYQIKNLNEVCAHIMFHFLCVSARVDKFFQEEIHDSYIWKND